MKNLTVRHLLPPCLLLAFVAVLTLPTGASLQIPQLPRAPEPGTEDATCRPTPPFCNGGLVCAFGFCKKPPPTPEPGTSGGACRGGNCNAGLECFGVVCLPRGGRGQPCRSDGGCDGNLACTPAGNCVDAGGLGQPCLPNEVCNAGLECLGGGPLKACAPPPPRGGPGQLCIGGTTCNAGLRCIAGGCVYAGGLLQPCRTDGSCNDNLMCQDGWVCVLPPPAGGLGQPCRPDGKCDAGLQCRNFLCVTGPVALRELPYELSLRDYLRRSFGGRFDAYAFREAAARAALLPAARLPLQAATGARRPGSITSALTAPAPAWEYVGPNNLDVPYRTYYGVRPVAGRVNAVAYSPANPSVLFAGSAAGGLFRSDDGGANWKPLSDGLVNSGVAARPAWPDLHISSIAFSPTDSNVLYVGLGDFHGQLPFAGGIMGSTDGGASWTKLGSVAPGSAPGTAPSTPFDNFAVSNILVDPDSPQILIATTGRGPGGEGQVWRSSDGGGNWTPVAPSPTPSPGPSPSPTPPTAHWSGAALGAADSTGTRSYYVAGTQPPDSNGARLPIIMRSLDKGRTWTQLAAPTSGDESVFALAASPVSPQTVYALLPKSRTIWRSDDRGNSWTDISAGFPSDRGEERNYNWSQGGYDYFIACTRRAGLDVLYVGLIDIVFSPDRGSTWSSAGSTYTDEATTHNDQHAIAFHPTDPNEFLLANDGGVYRGRFDPRNGATTFESLNRNLPVTMFRRAAFHPSDPDVMLGGTQDNATPVSTGDLQNWLNKGGGDGGGVAISQVRPNIQYATAQGSDSPIDILPFPGLHFFRTDTSWRLRGGPLDGWETPQQHIPLFTGGDRRSGQSGMPIYVDVTIDPGNSTVLYTATQFLWRLDDTFPLHPWRWFKVSPTALSTNSLVSRIAVAPSSRDTIYTASADGEVWASFDRGVNWRRLNAPPTALPGSPLCITNAGSPPSFNCPGAANALSVNPNDPNDVVVGFGTGGAGTLFRCTGTNTNTPVWTNLSGASPNALPGAAVNAVVRDPDRPETTFYVGTDVGVFMSDDLGTRWFNAGTALGLPAVQVTDLVAVPRTRFLNAATYGRGMWRLALPEDRPAIDEFTVSPAAVAGGETFNAQVTLVRTAPPTGVPITFTSSNPSAVPAPTPGVVWGLQPGLSVTLSTTPGLADASATITATVGGTSRSVDVRVLAADVQRIRIEPSAVKGSQTTFGTLDLSGVAPAGGATVSLSSDCAAARVPASVNIPAWRRSAAFDVQTSAVAQTRNCIISARLGGTQTAALTVERPELAGFGMDAAEVVRGRRVGGYLELDGPAPPGGLAVKLKSSSWFLVVPREVVIAAGQRRVQFTARARRFAWRRRVTLDAWIGNRTPQTRVLTTTVLVKWS